MLKFVERGLRRMLVVHGTVAQTGENFVGGFDRHTPFRPTQKEGLTALVDRLADDSIPIDERRIGYVEHATGLGKTAFFSATLEAAYTEAAREDLSTSIITYVIEPTTVLLHQTKEEIEDYAPSLKRPGMIGMYGDGKKELGRPVTIITYDSWVSLIEGGQINPAFVNIVIADEAHKNTSERREDITRILHEGDDTDHPDADSPQAWCLAVTATARYDFEKTVERSYKHKIHGKSLIEGVHSGELCDYIRTQNYIIRVDSGSRQEAWKKFVIEHFATGKDIESNQYLRDIVSAFYVDGTAFADEVAQGLNEHPDLARLAKERGMKGVAVAIHSKMPKGEQQRRLRDYMGYTDDNGTYHAPKYMAVVGDEKFKAGWNHQPLKCIFDYPRGSLVDKAQIEGRGSRRYIDPKTGQPTGLVLVDTILYDGSKDPGENEKNRQRAIANAVTFNQVTEGQTVVYRPGRKPRDETIERDDLDGFSTPRSWGRESGIGEVESFVSLEEIRTFNRETATAIAAVEAERMRDAVSDGEHEAFRQKARQKNVGAIVLFQAIPAEESLAAGLTVGMLATALNKQSIKLSYPHWNLVMAALDKMEDPLTDQEHAMFRQKAQQKDVGSIILLQAISAQEVESKGLTVAMLDAALGKRSTKLSRPRWNLAMAALDKMEDALTDQEHEAFRQKAGQKNIGARNLFRAIAVDASKSSGLTEVMLSAALKKQSTKLSRPRWNLVMAALDKMEDPLTDQEHAMFRQKAQQKDVSYLNLFRAIPTDEAQSANLTKSMLQSALDERSRKLSRSRWKLAMATLKTLTAQHDQKPANENRSETLDKRHRRMESKKAIHKKRDGRER